MQKETKNKEGKQIKCNATQGDRTCVSFLLKDKFHSSILNQYNKKCIYNLHFIFFYFWTIFSIVL